MTTPCYVFDIDGTVADCAHRLHHIVRKPGDDRPKDWSAFHAATSADVPIAHMVEVCRAIFEAGEFVVFVTARSEECRAATEAWLAEHVVPEQAVYMRRAGDRRKDDVVKMELLAELRRDGWSPVMVFEDRTRVVKAWRAAGIPCAQVAEGDF
jgi:predicted secreted acid phosphatase